MDARKLFTMKAVRKIALTVLSAFILSNAANAQNLCSEPGTWSIEAGLAPTSFAGTASTTEAIFRPLGEVFAVIFTFGLYTPEENFDEYSSSPGYSLRGGYQINKWLMVTGDLNYGTAKAIRKDEENGPILRTDRWKSLSVLPGVHFTYLNKKKWQLYSGLAAGAALLEQNDSSNIDFTFEVIPFGVRFGKKVYGSAELNWGTEFGPTFRGGVGIRF